MGLSRLLTSCEMGTRVPISSGACPSTGITHLVTGWFVGAQTAAGRTKCKADYDPFGSSCSSTLTQPPWTEKEYPPPAWLPSLVLGAPSDSLSPICLDPWRGSVPIVDGLWPVQDFCFGRALCCLTRVETARPERSDDMSEIPVPRKAQASFGTRFCWTPGSRPPAA